MKNYNTRSASIKTYLLVLILFFLPAKSFANQDSNTTPLSFTENKFNSDDILVLQVNVANSLIPDDQIIGYESEDGVFLSLKDFVRVLEFPIKFQSDNLSADGWFITENQTFSLDLKANNCFIKKTKYELSKNDLTIFQNDIFVNIETLKKWFVLDLYFNSQDQEIVVNSGGLLPIEKRFERQKEWQRLSGGKKDKENLEQTKEAEDVIKNNYKIASVPFGDINYAHGYSKSNSKSNSTSNLNALFAGDLLYLNNQLFTTISDGELSTVRLTSGRRDISGNLLGPLKATSFSLGDINTPELPLVSRSVIGRGATISNYPLEYVSQFNKVLIRGNAQPNWDVEIYRNDSLLDFQKVSSQGIYEFIDVPLISGANIIKLVFYGPFGQIYREERVFMVGNDLLKKGKLYYQFAANENNKDLIKVQPTNNQNATNASDGVGRFFGEVGYGLTSNTSIVANFLKIPPNIQSSQQNEYAGISLRSSLFGIMGRIDNVHDLDTKLNAQQLSLQTLLFENYNVSTILDRFDKNFVSETHQTSSDPLIYRSTSRVDGPLRIPFTNFPSRISFSAVMENYQSSQNRDDFENEIYFGLTRKLGLNVNTKYIRDERITGDLEEIVNGRTLINYYISDNLLLRGSISYNLKPTEELNSLDSSASYNFGNKFNLSGGISHQFASTNNPEDITSYSSAISKSFDKFLLSLVGNFNDNGDHGVNLNLSTSFGYDPVNNVGIISGTPIASSGAISAKVFIDDNNNGKFDNNEEPLKNIEVTAGGKKQISDENGVAFIPNIYLEGVIKTSINSDSLPDPYLLVRKKDVKIISHSGTVTNIEFPISRVGEVSGYVITEKKNNSINPAANVEMELVDQNNSDVVYKIKSGYDGYYIFEMIPFGKYELRISKEQSDRLGFFTSQSYDIDINKDNEFISKMNFAINYNTLPIEEREDSTYYKVDDSGKIKPKKIKYNIKNIGSEKHQDEETEAKTNENNKLETTQ